MDTKGMDKRVTLVTAIVAATAAVFFGGFAIPSVHALIHDHFETDFESSLIPACTTEEVAFSGIAVFDFKEKDGQQTVTMKYKNVKAEGIQTGTKYTVHEHDEYQTILNENGDTRFETTIHGTFISSGSDANTKITIKLINVIHPNGEEDTIVDEANVQCPG